MSGAEWLSAVDWVELAETAGVALSALLGAFAGVRTVAKRMGAVLRKVLGPELVQALVADVAKAVKPAVEKTLAAGQDKALVAAVRATVAEEMEEVREQLRKDLRQVLHEEGVGREAMAKMNERLAVLEALSGKRRTSGSPA